MVVLFFIVLLFFFGIVLSNSDGDPSLSAVDSSGVDDKFMNALLLVGLVEQRTKCDGGRRTVSNGFKKYTLWDPHVERYVISTM